MIGQNHIGKNGRFGNQMFQYAATRGIAHNQEVDLIIPDGPRTDDEFIDDTFWQSVLTGNTLSHQNVAPFYAK